MSNRSYSTEGFTCQTWRIDGVETVVHEIGRGPAVVYFHGGGTYHGFEWTRDFADSFRMIVPIHPNFGESGDAAFTTMSDYVKHYEMLFAVMGLERLSLIGASMGGHMAGRYAGEHAEEIDRLVLVAPAGLKSDKASIPDWTRIAPADQRAMFAADLAWLDRYWPAEPGPEWIALRQREAAASMAVREDIDTMDAAMRAALKGFERPTLLLWGSEDKVVPPGFSEVWQEVLPQAELAVIPGGAHLLLDESADARRAAREFLAR